LNNLQIYKGSKAIKSIGSQHNLYLHGGKIPLSNGLC